MPHERLRPSFVFDEERLKQLQQIVPEAFVDGNINWEVLKESLGERLEDETAEAEHFGLFWPGKREARKIASIPSKGALIPVKDEGVNEETTKNIFIEGENLEVLKLLQKSYAGRIKMIYIDPPYNTGNDFIYDDNFTQPIEEYLKYTGQMDEEGKLLTTNKRADGRFHSKWLSMMYPRLRLARDLLRDDGIILISIDDVEAINLKAIMNEIFGEENFIEQIVWKNKYGSGAPTRGFASVHEYIMCYSKCEIENLEAPLSEEQIKAYKNKDSKYAIRGGFITQPLATLTRDYRPNLIYPIIHNGKKILPDKQWIWSKERFEKAYKNDEIVINETDGKFSVRFKQYLKDEYGVMRNGKPVSILNGPFNQEGTKEMTELLGQDVYPFPKPKDLIKYLFSFSINDIDDKEGIYLDFFAGSGTSAQAILELNRQDGGFRKFICIQLPEICEETSTAYKKGYKNICEIAKSRIKKVINIMGKNLKEEKNKILDLGFKTFKLNKTNFKQWQDYKGKDPKELASLFKEHETPLVDDWKPENLLIEVMLQEGFPLDSETVELKAYKKNTVIQVTSEFCEHKLLVCFDKKIYQETIDALNMQGEDIFVCLDSALSDEQKITLSDKGFLKTI